MDDIVFTCPFCKTPLQVERELKGGLALCYNCDSTVMVPEPGIVPGMNIAGYIIEERLGIGGMGEVWLASHTTMGRKAAVKILSPALTSNPESVSKFMKEVETSAKLDHPNIVTAFDAGVQDGIYYLVTAFVDGETLKERLGREKTIPESEALLIVHKAAEALSYAWKNFKLIHSDVNPGNIMITWNGAVKLMDMGISKSMNEDAALTHSGMIMGTPHYMSPEQARVEPDIDCRSDIYSLGATLYHMVTGVYPFEASSAISVLARHLTDELVSPHKRNPGVSRPCSYLIRAMMAKNKDFRPDNWDMLMKEIEKVIRGEKLSLKPSGEDTRTGNIKESEKEILKKRKIKKRPPKAGKSKSRPGSKASSKRGKPSRSKKKSVRHLPYKGKFRDSASEKAAKIYVIGAVLLVFFALIIGGGLFMYNKNENKKKAEMDKRRFERIKRENLRKLREESSSGGGKVKVVVKKTVEPLMAQSDSTSVKPPEPAKKATPPADLEYTIPENISPGKLWDKAKKIGNRSIKLRKNFDKAIAFFEKAVEKFSGTEYEQKAVKAIETLKKAEELAAKEPKSENDIIREWKETLKGTVQSAEEMKIDQMAVDAASRSGAVIKITPAGNEGTSTPAQALEKMRAGSVLKFLPAVYGGKIEFATPDLRDVVIEAEKGAEFNEIIVRNGGRYFFRNIKCARLQNSTECVIVDSVIDRIDSAGGLTVADNCLVGQIWTQGEAPVLYARNCFIGSGENSSGKPPVYCEIDSTLKFYNCIIYSEASEAVVFSPSFSGSLYLDKCIVYSKIAQAAEKEYDFTEFKLIKSFASIKKTGMADVTFNNILEVDPGIVDSSNNDFRLQSSSPAKGVLQGAKDLGVSLDSKGRLVR